MTVGAAGKGQMGQNSGGPSFNKFRMSGKGFRRPVAYLRHSCYYIPVIADFADQGTEDIFYGVNSAAARRACPLPLHPSAWKKLERVNAVGELADLAWPPGNRLEALRGDRRGQHSIRINDQYRICFVWDGADARAVEIVDYHG